MSRLGSRMSYGEAQEELEWLWGVRASIGAIREATIEYGRLAEEMVTAEVKRLEEEGEEATEKPQQLMVCTDGAFVQTTKGEWREVKTVAFGEFESQWNPKEKQIVTKTSTISYFSRWEEAETFSRRALSEWHQRGGENAERVVAVNDGATWIQSFLDYHCPTAIRVIDFAHAQSYLAKIGKIVYESDEAGFVSWYAAASKQLGTQPPQRTLADLRFLQRQHDPQEENPDLSTALNYLTLREKMIDYPHFRKIEVPIGSGIGESGHKVVMQRRMKQAGMRWAEENINPMLALRNLLCNKRWQAAWPALFQQKRLKQRQQRLQLSPPQTKPPITFADVTLASHTDASSPPVSHSSIPAPDHPWRTGQWPLQHRY